MTATLTIAEAAPAPFTKRLYVTQIICDGSVSKYVIDAAKRAKCYQGSAVSGVPGQLDRVDVAGWHEPEAIAGGRYIREADDTLRVLGCN